MKRGGGKAGISTNVLHLPRFAPAVRLEPWQRLSVRAAVTLCTSEPTTSCNSCPVIARSTAGTCELYTAALLFSPASTKR